MVPLYPHGAAEPNTILVILPTWVGDFVMATPALRVIRERFASARIIYLLESNLQELAQGCPWADECIALPPRGKRSWLSRVYREFVRSLRTRKVDCAALLSNSFRSALLAWSIGAKNRIGYDRDMRGLLLTHPIPVSNRRSKCGEGFQRDFPSLQTTPKIRTGDCIPGRRSRFLPIPLVEYFADLTEALGCARATDKLELFVLPEDDAWFERQGLGKNSRNAPLVVLSPGARFGAAKCWPADSFAQAADRLMGEGAELVIAAGPGEESISGAIRDAMKSGSGAVTVLPLQNLGQLKSLIRRCDLLICNDAGPRHIAKAFDVPTVTIFGPTHPYWTATNYPKERIVRVDVDCGPCQKRICPLGHHKCMKLVTVDMVVAAAKELLAGAGQQGYASALPA